MQSLRIKSPRLCFCAENSEYCAVCPRKECTGENDCPQCPDEVRTMTELIAEFRSSDDHVVQAEVLLRKCDFAKDAPAFFAAHPSSRKIVQQLLDQGMGAADLSAWHEIFRESQRFLLGLVWRPDWR